MKLSEKEKDLLMDQAKVGSDALLTALIEQDAAPPLILLAAGIILGTFAVQGTPPTGEEADRMQRKLEPLLERFETLFDHETLKDMLTVLGFYLTNLAFGLEEVHRDRLRKN